MMSGKALIIFDFVDDHSNKRIQRKLGRLMLTDGTLYIIIRRTSYTNVKVLFKTQ